MSLPFIYMRKILVAIMAFTLLASVAEARKVKGTVTSGAEFLEGVVVTDGEHFTTTNFKGKFAFEINDDAEFVYLVTPAGYVADWTSGVPAFYQKATGVSNFLFDLQKTQKGADYNIIAIADPQMYTPEHFAMFEDAPLKDMTATAKGLTGLTVGIALGDISWDEIKRLPDYKNAIVKTGVPFYPVIGNHDHSPVGETDLEGSAPYRELMGPENYAFFIGRDVVIVIDNIIYKNGTRPVCGYADHVLAWVKGILPYIPAESEIFIAQHAPTLTGKGRIAKAEHLLGMLRGRKVTFMSGHSHENYNYTIEKNITEHNIAAVCAGWWDTEACPDGSPKGYKVFTKFGGRLSWYYKPIGDSKKHIAEAFGLGQMPMHPNSVVVNVWDWDPQWSVEWYEDGIPMGKMDPVDEISVAYTEQMEAAYRSYGTEMPAWKRGGLSGHHFAATPSRYAKTVLISVNSRFGQKWTSTLDLTGFVEKNVRLAQVDVDAVKAAAEAGANAVAFDLHVSMDGEVRAGSAGGMLLAELIDKVDTCLAEAGRSAIRYNIEMHTVGGKDEGKTVPIYHRYADYVMDGLWMKFLGDRLMVTGSDYRSLNHLNSRYPEVDIAFKVGADVEDVEKAMERLKFTPKWISFHYSKVDADLIKTYSQKGYNVSVWGIPDEETMNRIKAMGPDAVIY